MKENDITAECVCIILRVRFVCEACQRLNVIKCESENVIRYKDFILHCNELETRKVVENRESNMALNRCCFFFLSDELCKYLDCRCFKCCCYFLEEIFFVHRCLHCQCNKNNSNNDVHHKITRSQRVA